MQGGRGPAGGPETGRHKQRHGDARLQLVAQFSARGAANKRTSQRVHYTAACKKASHLQTSLDGVEGLQAEERQERRR